MSSYFYAITSTFTIYNFRSPVHNKIHDRHAGKIRDKLFYSIDERSSLTIKGNTWYIHDLSKTVGNNNIRASSPLILLLLFVFDISITV